MLLCAALLTACGGSGSGDSASGGATGSTQAGGTVGSSAGTPQPTTLLDAHRLAEQGSFGPSEALIADIQAKGAEYWVREQMTLSGNLSIYTSGGQADVHQWTGAGEYCKDTMPNCWLNNFSAYPLLTDFYHNAVEKPDQLRQRVAFAFQQLVVVSDHEVQGTYGHRRYQNMLLQHAFGNYEDIIYGVIASPVMGDFLNNANNDKASPNENFARELMQLFTIGLCELNQDGTLKGGVCTPTYDNETVRHYAYALTGWTYPDGGRNSNGCWPKGLNCRFYDGEMKAVDAYHDKEARTLLTGITVEANSTAESARQSVINSLINHPNIAPFVARHLIQHLVMSNPKKEYVARVAQAFALGKYKGFGTGKRGDLSATVAAVLLDIEARRSTVERRDGQLRQPALMMAGVTRALRGTSDGRHFNWWGDLMSQKVFSSPSVFNFFAPDYPVPGSALNLVGPAFGINNASTSINRINFLNCMVQWNCSEGTTVDLQNFLNQYLQDGAPGTVKAPASAADGKLVDRLSYIAYGQLLPTDERDAILDAMKAPYVSPMDRVKQAVWLVFASPRYQMVQ